MSAKVIYLHMGLHKTGTTSIQNWLATNTKLIQSHGYGFYAGHYQPTNHIEFALASLRENLDAPVKRNMNVDRDQMFEETRQQVADFISKSMASQIIISNETLSFIREVEEMERLRAILPDDISVVPIVFLRPKPEWLSSFRKQMLKMGMEETDDATSCAYFQPDTWLLQHETLIDLATRTFGDCKVVNYGGASLTQFLGAIGLEVEVAEPKLNVSRKQAVAGKVLNALHHLKKRFGT